MSARPDSLPSPPRSPEVRPRTCPLAPAARFDAIAARALGAARILGAVATLVLGGALAPAAARAQAAQALPSAGAGDTRAQAASLRALWAERTKCVVAVEFVTEMETDRRTSIAFGTVVDGNGTIIVPASAIDLRVPPANLKDFKIYAAGEPDGEPATYLGHDRFTGWHFLRVGAALARRLVPVTAFAGSGAPADVRMADPVWGIGLRNKDEDFSPYILRSHVALIQQLPETTAIAQAEVAGPGLPVFDETGRFVGLGASSFGQTYIEFSSADRSGSPIMLVNVEESSAFVVASEVLPYLGRVPANVQGRPLAWLGTYGLEPMDRDVAAFLKLSSQSGAVVSDVLEGSPAEKAGLRARDIILSVNGQPLPRLKPARLVVDYIDRLVADHLPGQSLSLTVLRGEERIEIAVVLAEEPTLVREADRHFFDHIGTSVRQLVYGDAIARHVSPARAEGVIVQFVKPNGPADIAGLRPEDWVREIDGVEVRGFADASASLAAIEADPLRREVVILVSRSGDTAVLHLKLR